MNYWIFQGNPDRFDVDTYIARQDVINWETRQKAKEISSGDVVFLWRASGSKKEESGVIAVAEVIEEPRLIPEEPSAHDLYREGDPNEEALRAILHITKKCIKPKEVIKKDWLLEDPVFKDTSLLKVMRGTNFLITAAQGQRLYDLCNNTGRDWTYNECVAGLWAYKETEGKEVSKLPGSPVANVAISIGRAVSGVYNKVMNYRSIDHRDTRKGFSSTNHIDHQVWTDFFRENYQHLDSDALDNAYASAWGNHSTDEVSDDVSLSSYSWTIKNNDLACKLLDKSAFLHKGTGIPIEVRSFFINTQMSAGQKTPIQLQLNQKSYSAHIEMDHQPAPRTRLLWDNDLSSLLRNLYPSHYQQFQSNVEVESSKINMVFERLSGFDSYSISFTGVVSNDTIAKDIEAVEIEDTGLSKEGAVKEYFGRRYERDPKNRVEAIKQHGLACMACGFNFEQYYGERGRDFIEVHHKNPIHTFEGKEQQVNPKTDLATLCSNCHRMIHRRADNVLSIEDIKVMIASIKRI